MTIDIIGFCFLLWILFGDITAIFIPFLDVEYFHKRFALMIILGPLSLGFILGIYIQNKYKWIEE